jgi:D-3-phosphoglycerate dehydrogenase / 2-oxoglutarate reductase
MSDGHILFSAPHDFLPEELKSAYEAVMPTEFNVMWTAEDVVEDDRLTVWAPNPGAKFVIDEGILERFPALEVIATPSTGRNHIDLDACARKGIAVYALIDDRETLDRIAGSPEFTFLLLLLLLRRPEVGLGETAARRWRAREDDMRGHELDGMSVGLVGYGRIGHRLARYCQAFNAKVSYTDPYVEDSDIPKTSIEAIFAESDVVFVCCGLTPETTDMVGGDLFRELKQNAYFINTSRGEVLKEQELADVLDERPDLSVAIDVLAGEVTGTQYVSPLIPFFDSGRILITPHIAGATFESQTKAANGSLRLIRRHYDID